MSNRPASPVFVGRVQELAALGGALDRTADGASTTVLVGGEAGIGKSRLVAEFAARAAERTTEDVRTLVGTCLELGVEGVPFAPFTAALRQAVRDLGVDGVAALLPEGPRELARLLPELGGSPPETEGSQLRLFEHVRMLLQALADSGPLLLVVEDAHWADGSTRDLMTFLVHNLDPARVLLVVTYRIDELHRTHPLRPLLAELDRTERVRRLELARLSRREVGAQLGGIIGHTPAPGLVQQVYDRSAGNPLFVESLVGSDGELRGLSDSLRDLLLAGVRRLPEETQRVLRAAAGAGSRVDHPLLAGVTDIDEGTLSELLRPAVDARVLVTDEHGYAFRHALLREALHDDLLPGERTRIHQRYAEALEDRPDAPAGCTAEIAHHWYAAHDARRALSAAWCAAAESKTALAYAEQLTMLERVLELWERVPDAARVIGSQHLRVLELAVAAARSSGAVDRGVLYATAALRELDEAAEPVRAALLLVQRGRMRGHLGNEAGLDDLRRAAKLVPPEPPSPARAKVLAALAGALIVEPNEDEAEALAAEALEVARRIGDAATEANALITLGCVLGQRGEFEEAIALYDAGRAIARRSDEPLIAARADNNEASTCEEAGLHERAVEVARRGMTEAAAHGLTRTSGTFIANQLAESLMSLGRWDEAMEVVQSAIELAPPPIHRAMHATTQGFLALARGDLATVETAVLTTDAVLNSCYVSAQDQLPPVQLEVTLRLAQRRPFAALEEVTAALATYRIELARSPRHSWPLLAVAAEVCAACADAPTRDGASAASVASTVAELRAVAAGLPAHGPVQHAQRATFLAAADDAVGARGDWSAAVAAWEATAQPYPLAQVLLRAAAAADGDRDRSASLLSRSAAIADRLGGVTLRGAVDDLARRSRVPVGGAATAPIEPGHHGLTPRELEVLRLVAGGYSNRRIAAELFISAKTASVHVSNILAKLGAANRGEAAAAAHRLGLPDVP